MWKILGLIALAVSGLVGTGLLVVYFGDRNLESDPPPPMLVAASPTEDAKTLETVSGQMNLIMLPMWILSGVFFSSERFPEVAQHFINLLPLTALNQLLRGIILEGRSLAALWQQAIILAVYSVTTFAVALRVFRWK